MEATHDAGRGDQAAAISSGAVQIVREFTGRGPTRARTTITHEHDLVTIVLGDTLTKGERRLADGGAAQRVLDARQDFQQMMRDDLVALVETQLDRKVVAFMSANHIDPDIAAETFVLAPVA